MTRSTACMLYFCLCIAILSYSSSGLSLVSKFNSQLVQRNGNNNDASSGFYIRKTTPHNTKVTYRRDSLSSVFQLRSGNSFSALSSIALANPQALFNALLVSLAALAVIGKTAISINRSESEDSNDKKPPAVRSLQIKFLGIILHYKIAAFWNCAITFLLIFSGILVNAASWLVTRAVLLWSL